MAYSLVTGMGLNMLQWPAEMQPDILDMTSITFFKHIFKILTFYSSKSKGILAAILRDMDGWIRKRSSNHILKMLFTKNVFKNQ